MPLSASECRDRFPQPCSRSASNRRCGARERGHGELPSRVLGVHAACCWTQCQIRTRRSQRPAPSPVTGTTARGSTGAGGFGVPGRSTTPPSAPSSPDSCRPQCPAAIGVAVVHWYCRWLRPLGVPASPATASTAFMAPDVDPVSHRHRATVPGHDIGEQTSQSELAEIIRTSSAFHRVARAGLTLYPEPLRGAIERIESVGSTTKDRHAPARHRAHARRRATTFEPAHGAAGWLARATGRERLTEGGLPFTPGALFGLRRLIFSATGARPVDYRTFARTRALTQRPGRPNRPIPRHQPAPHQPRTRVARTALERFDPSRPRARRSAGSRASVGLLMRGPPQAMGASSRAGSD